MNLQETVLAALVPRTPADKPDVDKCLQLVVESKVNSQCFDEKYRYLFEFVMQKNLQNVVVDEDILDAQLMGSFMPKDEQTEYKFMFNDIKNTTISPEKLKQLLPAFVEEQMNINFGEIIVNAAKIHREGLQLGKQNLRGMDDAKKYLIKHVAELQRYDVGAYPQSDLKDGMDAFVEDYFLRKANPQAGCLTGMKEMDDLTHGAKKGELWIVSAYSGEGKSTMMRNWAYHQAIHQKKNVVFASLEMPYKQVFRKFVTLHSLHEKFGSMGLLDRELRHGSLNQYNEELLTKTIAPDLKTFAYGKLHILQLPHNESVTTLREKLMYLNMAFPIDCVYVDYASLMKTEFRWPSKQQMVEEIMKDLKQLAMDFNEGQGVPIITAHQISREKRDKAALSKSQKYDIGFLADSASVERTADFVLWMLRTDEMRGRQETKCGIHKYRDDEVIPEFMVSERYEYGKLESFLNKGSQVLQLGV